MMADPKLIMLDEPMAGVNPALTQSLLGHVKRLRSEGITVMFVEHDMDVVRDISDWVVVMAEGAIIAEGPSDAIGSNQAVDRRLPRLVARRADRGDHPRRRPEGGRGAGAGHGPRAAPRARTARGARVARGARRCLTPTATCWSTSTTWSPATSPRSTSSGAAASSWRRGELIGIIGPNGAGKSTMLKALFGLIPIRSGTVSYEGEDVTGRKANVLVAKGIGYVPQINNVFPSLTVNENLEMGGYLRKGGLRERLDWVVSLFPRLGERIGQRAGLALGWGAADAGDGSGADDGAQGAAARRAVGRSVADAPGPGVRAGRAGQRRRRSRSSWSSRTPPAACRSATAATSSTRAATPTPAPAQELMTDPKVIELYLGTLAKAR